MNAQQWYSLRTRHGMHKADMAKLVWTSELTIYFYEAGKKSDPARFELAAMKLNDAIALDQVERAREVQE